MCSSLSSANDDYIALSPEPYGIIFLKFHSKPSITITIPIINDNVHEEMEQFTVQLSLPSGSTGVVLDQDSATVHIVDDDSECSGLKH